MTAPSEVERRGVEQPVWARMLVAGLTAAGVTDVVISPGSRSTPLVLALLDEPALRKHSIVDERSAAFFALGQARVSGRPTVLVRTSGTAGANDYPAVVEASASYLPLLVVTADRPPELQQVQANQTIEQVDLFGRHVRGFFELGTVEATPLGLRAMRRVAVQAVTRSRHPEPGPVHLNVRFRKPLEPPGAVDWLLDEDPTVARVSTLRHDVDAVLARPAPTAPAPYVQPSVYWSTKKEQFGRMGTRGLILAGPTIGTQLVQRRQFQALLMLSRQMGWPIYAEATSQLRMRGSRQAAIDEQSLGDAFRDALAADLFSFDLPDPASESKRSVVLNLMTSLELDKGFDEDGLDGLLEDPATVCFVDGLDAILRAAARDGEVPEALRPEIVVQVGRPPVSGAVGRLLEQCALDPEFEHWALAGHGWPDASSSVTEMLVGDPDTSLLWMTEATLGDDRAVRTPWLERWEQLAEAARDATDAALASGADPDGSVPEGLIARVVAESLPEDGLLMVGNSLPIRTVDAYVFGDRVDAEVGVLSQRGASGIDGLVSGAAGAASVSGRPTALLLGDVSLLHDAGGLASAATATTPLVLVVVHNGGGRIFEQLPIARRCGVDTVDMAAWTTPHARSFRHLAAFYGLSFARAADEASLRAAVAEALEHAGPTLIEAIAPPHGAAEVSRDVVERLRPQVAEILAAASAPEENDPDESDR